MDIFFQLVSVFALFFGIAGLVYATEVSRRCQLLIEERMTEAETQLAEQSAKQDRALQNAISALGRTARSLEETEMAQTREINAIRHSVEPLLIAYQKAEEEKAKADKRNLAVRR